MLDRMTNLLRLHIRAFYRLPLMPRSIRRVLLVGQPVLLLKVTEALLYGVPQQVFKGDP
jgi:hypothetical protein